MRIHKYLFFTSSRLRDIKIQGNANIHASFVGKGATTKEYTSFPLLQMNAGITKKCFVVQDSSTMHAKQPIGTL